MLAQDKFTQNHILGQLLHILSKFLTSSHWMARKEILECVPMVPNTILIAQAVSNREQNDGHVLD